MSNAKIGIGTILSLGNGADPEVFTAVAELTKIEGPGQKRDALEATNMDTDPGFREYIGGLGDGGEVSIEGNYLPNDTSQSDNDGLMRLFNATWDNSVKNWKIEENNGDVVWAFAAILTEHTPTRAPDKLSTFTATLKVTGNPLITGA